MYLGLVCTILLALCTVNANGQRLRVEGRVYADGKPMEIGPTNCQQLDSSPCQILQQSVCRTLISLIPENVSRAVSCANYQIRREEEKHFQMGLDLQFQSNNEAMRNMNVTCATFTSLYLLELRASVRQGGRTLGDPVSIQPHPYEYDWDSDRVEFSVEGTLLVNDAKVPIEQKDTINLGEVQTKLYIAPGRQRMILPIYSRGQFEMRNFNLFNQDGFVGLSFLLTYQKSMIMAYRLDPSCNTFATLLQDAFRSTRSGASYQMGTDTRVNLLTRLNMQEESDKDKYEDSGSDQLYPDESSSMEEFNPDEDKIPDEIPTDEAINAGSDDSDDTDTGSNITVSSLFIALPLLILSFVFRP